MSGFDWLPESKEIVVGELMPMIGCVGVDNSDNPQLNYGNGSCNPSLTLIILIARPDMGAKSTVTLLSCTLGFWTTLG